MPRRRGSCADQSTHGQDVSRTSKRYKEFARTAPQGGATGAILMVIIIILIIIIIIMIILIIIIPTSD